MAASQKRREGCFTGAWGPGAWGTLNDLKFQLRRLNELEPSCTRDVGTNFASYTVRGQISWHMF